MISMGNILNSVQQILLPKPIVFFNAMKSRYSWKLIFFHKVFRKATKQWEMHNSCASQGKGHFLFTYKSKKECML